MPDLRKWFSVDPGEFRFGPKEVGPLVVTVTRTIMVPGPKGGVPTGQTIVSTWLDGALVDRHVDGCTEMPPEASSPPEEG